MGLREGERMMEREREAERGRERKREWLGKGGHGTDMGREKPKRH